MINSILFFSFNNSPPCCPWPPSDQTRRPSFWATTDVDQSDCVVGTRGVWMLRHSQHCESSAPLSWLIRDLDEHITLGFNMYALYRLINMFDFVILFYFAKVIVLNIFIHQNGVIRQLYTT